MSYEITVQRILKPESFFFRIEAEIEVLCIQLQLQVSWIYFSHPPMPIQANSVIPCMLLKFSFATEINFYNFKMPPGKSKDIRDYVWQKKITLKIF